MKIFLHNPASGAPIKNWYDGSERWSLMVDEIKAFPVKTARQLQEIFGFLQEVNQEEYEKQLIVLEEKEVNPTKIKVDMVSGEIVPKLDSEIKAEVEEVKVKKEKVRNVLAKVKKAPEAEPENPPYEEWTRGEVFSEVSKRNLEIKGLGKSRISKEQLISLLVNDDNK